MDPKILKSDLRDAIRDRLSHMSDTLKAAESRSVSRRVMESLPKEAMTVCAYVPMKSEVDIRPVLEHLLEKKTALFLPRFEGKLVFRKVTSLTELIPGTLGVMEPPASAAELDPQALAVALVPARAYARDGRRLGRGNGGYDIWIRAQRKLNPKTQFWGICYDAQLVNDVPMEDHDERVDAVITGRGLIECKEK